MFYKQAFLGVYVVYNSSSLVYIDVVFAHNVKLYFLLCNRAFL